MSLRFSSLATQGAFGLLAALGILQDALADGDRSRVPLLPKYQQECAACHLAYPPGMLPATSWKRVMANLPRHYGTDASLDPATVKQLSTWLGANAGTYKRVSEEPPQDRITTSSWFEGKHREVAPQVWKRAAIGSRANCAACHTGADKGDFDDDNIRIPK
ncbi:diheme cytochrome c [Polaromonas glacialis]|uniref:diheme cytochrome c n=1 Tax=Polaromonas glacialis TaxID=866564 RepID=UPI000497D719|nr:diheme cytochrome c [Polaromonas glacialis]